MLNSNDHRKIAKQLDLFHMRPEAPGMVFWHPRGFAMFRALEDAVRAEMRRQGLSEVRTPQLLRQSVWEASGHWDHFREGMFHVDEDRPAALKPVSCPAHLYIAKASRISYRELPLRLGEIGIVHRNEKSGNLHGLFRLRQFSQDDGHILCAPEQVAQEVEVFCSRLLSFYAAFGFSDIKVCFSSRPAERLGDDSMWDEAESMLRQAAVHAGIELVEQPGEGAFYGPKLEMSLRDQQGKRWQCGTIQLDLVMPERFDVSYIDAGDQRRRPALLHRALLGSLERFLGIVLESSEGVVPDWLAAEQVCIVPIKPAQQANAERLHGRLVERGLRARVDARNESVSRRVLASRELRIPIVAVIGPREVQEGAVALRHDEQQRVLSEADAVEAIAAHCASPFS